MGWNSMMHYDSVVGRLGSGAALKSLMVCI